MHSAVEICARLPVFTIELVLYWIVVVVATRSKCIHHQLVAPVLAKSDVEINWGILMIFWFLFLGCLGLFGTLVILLLLVGIVLVLDEFELLVLDDVNEGNCCHMRIVSCLMVV